MARKIYTPDLIAEVVAVKDRFPTLKALADHFGVYPDDLSKHLRANGTPFIRKKVDIAHRRPDINPSEVAELYESGVHFDDIVKAFGCSSAIIIAKLKSLGVVLRKERRAIATSFDYEIARLFEEGMSVLAISREIGRSRGYVTKRLSILNIGTRGCSEANTIRMGRMPPAERAILTHKARETHLRKLCDGGVDSGHISIGVGEVEFADALRRRGVEFQSQVMLAPYSLDFVVGNIAVEIKSGPVSTGSTALKPERLEKIFESGKRVVLIGHTGLDVFISCLPHIITTLERLNSNPPSAGKYWVIRCGPYNSASRIKGADLSPVVITPDYMATLRKID